MNPLDKQACIDLIINAKEVYDNWNQHNTYQWLDNTLDYFKISEIDNDLTSDPAQLQEYNQNILLKELNILLEKLNDLDYKERAFDNLKDTISKLIAKAGEYEVTNSEKYHHDMIRKVVYEINNMYHDNLEIHIKNHHCIGITITKIINDFFAKIYVYTLDIKPQEKMNYDYFEPDGLDRDNVTSDDNLYDCVAHVSRLAYLINIDHKPVLLTEGLASVYIVNKEVQE